MFIIIAGEFSNIMSDLMLVRLVVDNLHESGKPSIQLVSDFLLTKRNPYFFIFIVMNIHGSLSPHNMLILNKLKEN
jgi:hypothetical protein